MRDIFNIDAFKYNKIKKEIFFFNNFKKLSLFHYQNSKDYRKIINFLKIKLNKINSLKDFPFISVRMFKNHELTSIKKKDRFKILTSSGTSGVVSKIYLSKENSQNQSKVLHSIVSKILGKKRLPMLIIDQNPFLIKNDILNARKAAILGFSIFGKEHTYVLDQNDKLDYVKLNNFLKKYSGKKFLIFGFTHLIYKNFIEDFFKDKIKFDFKNAILLHGGGWRKLENKKISKQIFKQQLKNNLKISLIHNYYGMVEQTGSIFIECYCGYFVTSIFSDIIIRDYNFNILKNHNKGIIQLLSLLPTSYPGHNILTEDMGEIINQNLCKCEIIGKKFIVHGRIKEAELRGCSDI